jgi:hypothetical protein
VTLEGACHCGAVQVEVPHKPRRITSCNCSICRRYGSLMAYFDPARVKISAPRGGLDRYRWGDRQIAFVRCANCGCFVGWEPMRPPKNRMGVNMRNFDPAAIAGVRVRRFDGATTWRFLD